MTHSRVLNLGIFFFLGAAALVVQLGCTPLPGIVPWDDTEPESSVTQETDATDTPPTTWGRSFVHIGGFMGSVRGQISRGWIAASGVPNQGTLTGASTRLRIVVGPTDSPVPVER
ncbi:MAG: hypothetical protein MUC50_20540 [Myxococcota bacterium]|jgi:hypothetical protein|nr:hypothetical protein [Myxococcota bacterium]